MGSVRPLPPQVAQKDCVVEMGRLRLRGPESSTSAALTTAYWPSSKGSLFPPSDAKFTAGMLDRLLVSPFMDVAQGQFPSRATQGERSRGTLLALKAGSHRLPD